MVCGGSVRGGCVGGVPGGKAAPANGKDSRRGVVTGRTHLISHTGPVRRKPGSESRSVNAELPSPPTPPRSSCRFRRGAVAANRTVAPASGVQLSTGLDPRSISANTRPPEGLAHVPLRAGSQDTRGRRWAEGSQAKYVVYILPSSAADLDQNT